MLYLPWGEFMGLVEDARHEARRQQLQTAQLTWLVGSALGVKNKSPEDWLTGYAKDRDAQGSALPGVLQGDLDAGLELNVLSQAAFDALSA